MKTLEDLKKTLKDDETLKTFRSLEKEILDNPDYKAAYDDLLQKQQRMVQAEHKKAANLPALKREYDAALETLKTHPVIEQYLHLQEDINKDVQMLFSILETELNNDLDT